MGRIANYREKLAGLRACCSGQEPQINTILRLIDSLEPVGLIDGTSGFCQGVASSTGYSRNRVSDILSCKNDIPDRFLTSLCSAYDLDKHYILTGEGETASPRDLAGRIRSARRILGLSQTSIAKAAGSSLPAWQGYESGKNIPGGNVLAGLARLGININWLLLGEGPTCASGPSPPDAEIEKKVDHFLAEIRQAIFTGVDLMAKQMPQEPRSAGEVLDEIRRIRGIGSDKELGKVLGGLSQSTIASWRTRRTLDYDMIIKFCVSEGLSLDDVFLKKSAD